MSKLYSLKLIKEASLIRSFFFLLSIVVFNVTLAQEVKVKHYQRKLAIDNFILPNDKYDAKLFSILIPDTVYSGGELRVKFLKLDQMKVAGIFYFSANFYFKVIYIVRNKHLEEFLGHNDLLMLEKQKGYQIKRESISGNKVQITIFKEEL